jgi:hypothetical protein
MNPGITYEALIYKNTLNCRKYKKNVPNLKPYISTLSQYSSPFNSYIKVYITGENFLPNDLTTVTFGNIQNISVKYINSNSIYFELHTFAFPGVYNILVKNRLNLNARNVTANNSSGISLQSNVVKYTITH